jgi:tetratricopeptide (TPR) repeat protein
VEKAGMAMAPPMPGPPATLDGWAKGAQLFDGLGDFHRKATTRSAEAQAYFDQGMRLIWAFNHDEATRSFARAGEIDPTCAACWWGVALSLGPNYNLPLMADPRGRVGWEAVARARAAANTATPVEQALIEAAAERFHGADPLDAPAAAARLTAYAQAMEKVAARFPGDLDVQVLTAEAEMNVNPWRLWAPDGQPAAGTPQLVARLEAVLAKDPMHPGANHYYIHALEASPHPEKALVAASRLPGLMPAAGHIVHMPAHILQRVGRYEDSAQANRAASEADAAYYQKTSAIDYYPMYTAHNYQFLAYSDAMQGRRDEAIGALRKARGLFPEEALPSMPGADWMVGYVYQGMIRFGLWDAILAEPAPAELNPGLVGSWLEARAIAFARKGRIAEAKEAAARLEQILAATPPDPAAGQNSRRDMLGLALALARGSIAQAQGDWTGAVGALREAVAREDKTIYDEPADCFLPARHLLGAALLMSGDPKGAETVYIEDLARNPDNGWSLKGLSLALAAQGRTADAAQAARRFDAAWTRADVSPPGSAF